jgi:hypothetical protein
LQSQLPGGEGGPFGPLLGPAITTGTPNAANTGFFLVINGTNFSTEYFDHVQWADPIVGNCEIYFGDQACDGAYIYNVTATQVVVFIPFGLYSTAVALPDSVQIQVFQYLFTGNNYILQDSNVEPYTLNPPLALPASGAALPPGVVGNAYSQPFFYGGTPPYTHIISTSGALPPGLPTPTNSQLLAGTPLLAGNYSFTLSVTDEWGNVISLPESLLIVSRLQITTASLPSAVTGSSYSVPLAATGGFPGYTWSATGLPNSLTLNSQTGVLSGTAPAPGAYTFGFTVTDSSGATASVSLQDTFVARLHITTASLPSAVTGSSYSVPLAATGGFPGYTWSATGLPASLTLNSQTGVLSGTAPAPGAYTFGFTVTDSTQATASVSLQDTFVARLHIITTSLPSVPAGSSYGVPLAAAGGFPPYTWSATGLPASLTLNSQTGVLSGTAPPPGAYTFGFTVVDSTGATASASFLDTFTAPPPPPLNFMTASLLPGGVVGTPYSTVFQATGGTPGYQFSLVGGSLPGGLTLNSSGVLAGTPTAYGQFSITVQTTDSTGTSTSLVFILTIRPAPLVITTGTSLTAPVGTPISIAFVASGGAPPYSFSATGSFPGGAQFSGAGVLTAPAPIAVGTYSFQVSVADTQGNSISKSFTLTIAVATLVITTTSPLSNATVGTAYSAGFAATGGAAPYTWTATGTPPGLGLSSAGVLSGTPTASGPYTLSVTVTDSSRASATGSFALTVSPAALTITTTSLPNGAVGVAYSAGFSATGGVTPYTWSLGGLPAGLSGSSSGAISGTPTAVAAATVTATVTDASGAKATTSLTLTVTVPPLAITTTTTSLPNGVVGTPYSGALAATGGVPPYTWTASGLPAGVSLVVSPSGTSLSGTPTATGTFQVSVTVKDSAGTTASASFPVSIGLPSLPTVTLTGLSPTTGPASQPPIQIGISSSYPVPITVNLTLTFTPVSGADDPSVQFSTGGRTAQETIAAGSTLALPALAIQTGTVAGTITVTAQLLAGTQDVTPTPAPSTTLIIASLAPVITKVSTATAAGGFTITVVGYATSRQVTQAVLQFTPAPGTTLSAASFTIPTTSLFTTWYGSAAAAPYGSQFTFTQPFTVSGSPQAVTSVSVTLSNSQGNSNTVTAPVP